MYAFSSHILPWSNYIPALPLGALKLPVLWGGKKKKVIKGIQKMYKLLKLKQHISD